MNDEPETAGEIKKSDKVSEPKQDLKMVASEKDSAAKDAAIASAGEQADEPAGQDGGKKVFGWKLMMPRDIKKAAIKALLSLLVLFLLTVAVFSVLVYGYKSEHPAVKAFVKEIPLPVERVNNSFVSYYDYLFEIDANKRAYQNNAKLNNEKPVDFSSAEGKKLVVKIKQHALDTLKSNAVTAQLAAKNKVKVTDKDIDNLLKDLYKRYGGKDNLLKTIKQIYNWNSSDLRDVVRRQLLSKKLEEKITTDSKMLAQTKAKAQDVLDKIKAGADFSEMAKKYSQASDASNGGSLGTFTKNQLPANVQDKVAAVAVGEVSDLIKTDYGYEIIKVTAKDGDNITALHILIKTTDFNEYFNAELKKAKTTVFIKIS